MSVLATIRPDDWNLPLFLHILGGFATVGALILATTYLVPAWRSGALESLRLGYKALLVGALPAYLVMRVGAEWIYSKEGLDDLPEDPDWVGIGYGVSDIGLLLLVIATVVAGVGVRRARQAGTAQATGGRVAAGLVGLLIVMYLVAIWAMTTKPT
jgi:hypothetical protein